LVLENALELSNLFAPYPFRDVKLDAIVAVRSRVTMRLWRRPVVTDRCCRGGHDRWLAVQANFIAVDH
jgi:hypothetical protein